MKNLENPLPFKEFDSCDKFTTYHGFNPRWNWENIHKELFNSNYRDVSPEESYELYLQFCKTANTKLYKALL